MTTQEKNKVIARWMANDAVNSPHLKDARQLEYHSSWDWLMPVVEKINLTTDNLRGDLFYLAHDIIHVIRIEVSMVKLKQAHDSVFKFIEWYNANVKEK